MVQFLGSTIYSFIEEHQYTYLLGSFVSLAFVGLSVFFAKKMLEPSDVTPRIVPYFKEHVGETNAFGQGQALAKNCRFLDDLAHESGNKGLSDFGFRDDYYSEEVTWYEPQEGLQMIRRLLEELKKAEAPEVIMTELELVQEALNKAQENKIPFCFLVRRGRDQMISMKEMDDRVGSFW